MAVTFENPKPEKGTKIPEAALDRRFRQILGDCPTVSLLSARDVNLPENALLCINRVLAGVQNTVNGIYGRALSGEFGRRLGNGLLIGGVLGLLCEMASTYSTELVRPGSYHGGLTHPKESPVGHFVGLVKIRLAADGVIATESAIGDSLASPFSTDAYSNFGIVDRICSLSNSLSLQAAINLLAQSPEGDKALEVGRFEKGGNEPDVHLHSPIASRKHCTLSVKGGSLVVEDLGSTNGTFVDDQRLAKNTPFNLQAGQILRLAHHDYIDPAAIVRIPVIAC